MARAATWQMAHGSEAYGSEVAGGGWRMAYGSGGDVASGGVRMAACGWRRYP
jgi:hypothetical protein